jgi:hypothetical protein
MLAGHKYGFGTETRFLQSTQRLQNEGDSPGPGSYSAVSGGVGIQRSSAVVSEPAFGFGSSNRAHRARCFLSAEHSKCDAGNFATSPGPAVYKPAPSIGLQHSTRGRTAPGWKFGAATRFRADIYDKGTPGPGAYAI